MAYSKGGTHFYAIVGIMLVLLVLGMAGILGIEIKRVSTNFKENLLVEVELSDSLNTAGVSGLQQAIKGKPFVKNIKFISKEEAAEMLKKDYGEGYLDILGYNPLYNSFLLNLYEGYANSDSIEKVRTELSALGGINRVSFPKNVLDSLNNNLGRIWLIILVVIALLLAFAVSLIFNTIRLAMFSKRFTIKTMQLFGATRWFIIKPFLGKSIVDGLISGLTACILLLGGIWYFDYTQPELALQRDLFTFALLFGALILFGIIISFLSTLTAVLRYLRIKVDDLY